MYETPWNIHFPLISHNFSIEDSKQKPASQHSQRYAICGGRMRKQKSTIFVYISFISSRLCVSFLWVKQKHYQIHLIITTK